MALKDWKKVGSNRWKMKDKKKANEKTLMLQDYVNGFKLWLRYGDGDIIDKGFFKSKPQALKFAKQYMRTH